MRAAAVFLVLALSACGAAQAPERAPPVGEAQAAEPDTHLLGAYKASSNTARHITGDVAIERAGLTFDTGVVLYTRLLHPRVGGDLIAKGGDSYAAAAVGPGDLNIELRRVTEQVVPEGATGVCGAEAPQYVALAFQERATAVTVLVFTGDEPPGPDAEDSRVCARFGYVAPSGARTRQGVVLQ